MIPEADENGFEERSEQSSSEPSLKGVIDYSCLSSLENLETFMLSFEGKQDDVELVKEINQKLLEYR